MARPSVTLEDILSAMPKLSVASLSLIRDVSSSLLINKVDETRAKRGSKPSSSSSKKEKKIAHQAKPAYADVPEYLAYRRAGKQLTGALKSLGVSLKEALTNGIDDPQKSVARFIEARNCWFRAKVSFGSDASPTPDPKGQTAEEKAPAGAGKEA
jgi:hypothetical protein